MALNLEDEEIEKVDPHDGPDDDGDEIVISSETEEGAVEQEEEDQSKVTVNSYAEAKQYAIDHFPDYQYLINCELGLTPQEPKEGDVKVCMAAAVQYGEIAQNTGYNLLHTMGAKTKGILADRYYMPTVKLNALLSRSGLNHFSAEYAIPLNEFDSIGFSMYYILQIVNFSYLLKRNGIPYLSKDRTEKDPIIVHGGSVAYLSQIATQCLDLVFVGDGDEQYQMYLDKLLEYKRDHKYANRKEFLLACAREIPGVYMPSAYKFEREGNKYTPLYEGIPAQVRKACCNIEKLPVLTTTIFPNSDSFGLPNFECARGCDARCYFCQAGYIGSPYREQPCDKLLECADELERVTGCHNRTPYSFNIGSHSSRLELLSKLAAAPNAMGISSQRIDMFTEEFAQISKATGHSSLTFAIETADDSLRRSINKNLPRETIIKAFETAFRLGFTKIKIYFMYNLPGETYEDIMATEQLVKEILAVKPPHSKCQIRLSFTPFSPQPFTPFQRAACNQDHTEWIVELAKKLREIDVAVRCSTSRRANIIVAVLSRLTPLDLDLLDQISNGPLNSIDPPAGTLKKVQDYVAGLGMTMDDILGELPDGPLPWEIVSCGTTRKHFEMLYARSKERKEFKKCTPNCRACGACTDEVHTKYHKDHDITPEESAKIISVKHPVVGYCSFKFTVDEKWAGARNELILVAARKALINAGVKILKTVRGGIPFDHESRVYGTFIGACSLYERCILPKELTYQYGKITDFKPIAEKPGDYMYMWRMTENETTEAMDKFLAEPSNTFASFRFGQVGSLRTNHSVNEVVHFHRDGYLYLILPPNIAPVFIESEATQQRLADLCARKYELVTPLPGDYANTKPSLLTKKCPKCGKILPMFLGKAVTTCPNPECK